MNPHLEKQLKILLIIFSPLIIFLIFKTSFFFFSQASCSDGRKNQGEEGIDCGGPCPPCEIKNLQPLTISSLRKINYQNESYDLAAKVFNPNENWGLKEVFYSFVLFDENGKEIFRTPKEKSIIYPNETRWLISQNLTLPNFASFKIDLDFDDYDWQKMENNFSPLDLVTYEPIFETTPWGAVRISFNVYNKTIYDFDNLEAIVFIYNKEKELIGLNKINFQIKHDKIEKIEFVNNLLEEKPENLEIFFQRGQ